MEYSNGMKYRVTTLREYREEELNKTPLAEKEVLFENNIRVKNLDCDICNSGSGPDQKIMRLDWDDGEYYQYLNFCLKCLQKLVREISR